MQGIGCDAITTISVDAIGPFLSQPLIIEDGELAHAPHIVAMQVGDHIISRPIEPILNYVPHALTNNVNARVVSIYGGVAMAAQNQIATINQGKDNNIDIDTVLQLYRFGKTIRTGRVARPGYTPAGCGQRRRNG